MTSLSYIKFVSSCGYSRNTMKGMCSVGRIHTNHKYTPKEGYVQISMMCEIA